MAKKSDHIHKYKRINLAAFGKPEYLVFKCVKPTCPHYVPIKLALGLLCECNRCHDLMTITKETINLALPHCVKCIKRKIRGKDVESITEFLNKSGL